MFQGNFFLQIIILKGLLLPKVYSLRLPCAQVEKSQPSEKMTTTQGKQPNGSIPVTRVSDMSGGRVDLIL